MQVFLFNEILPKRGREIFFSSKKCTPKCKCNSIFQTKREISMHPNNLQGKIKERYRECLT